ncbi:acyltransferase family protein [Luteimonas panaciterrae]|uniref:acyltransferase family protein n=1 Tax=Luteimonas panaciterrae TaxID=363885 RepID=UPI001CF9A818|nr:acyltransferase [Luteimonas panaciterrae]
MRSSSGEHFVALDHVRALAAFIVFCGHFLHGQGFGPTPVPGTPIRLDYTPNVFPLAILDEGHTGVALFMTLSGYLFARLLEGRRISYSLFLWNRALRLLPLLLLVVVGIGAYHYLANDNFAIYLQMVKWGWLLPTLPNGGWSITVEMHFYILLPLLLVLARRSPWWLLVLTAAAIALRAFIFWKTGKVQATAYLTLIGHIDHFLLGMLACYGRNWLRGRHWLAVGVALAIMLLYWKFDQDGGFSGSYYGYSKPWVQAAWIYLFTFEGIAYSILIAYYDATFQPKAEGVSGVAARIGAYSYSIYLLHFFLVFKMASFVDGHIMQLSGRFYLACLWAVVCFLAMYPIGYLSYRLVEAPFLRRRRPYFSDTKSSEHLRKSENSA